MSWNVIAALVVGLVVGYVFAVVMNRPQVLATPMSDAGHPDEHAPATGSMGAASTLSVSAMPIRTNAAPLREVPIHLVDENIDSLASA